MVLSVLLSSELLFLDFLKFIVYALRLGVVDKEIIFHVKHSNLVTSVVLFGYLWCELRLVLAISSGFLGLSLLRLLLAEDFLQVLRQAFKFDPLKSALGGGKFLARLVEDVHIIFLRRRGFR